MESAPTFRPKQQELHGQKYDQNEEYYVSRFTPHDEALLSFYFAAYSLFQRSPMGTQLDRASTLAFDSEKHRVEKTASWHWQPPGSPAPKMHLTSQHNEPAYTIDDESLLRFAEASRKLAGVSKQHKEVLERYYGDIGAVWAQQGVDRFDAQRRLVHKGCGPGSIAALYALTSTGGKFLRRERKKLDTRNKVHRTLDDVLRALLAAEAEGPWSAMREEAERLLVGAWRAYTKNLTAGKGASM